MWRILPAEQVEKTLLAHNTFARDFHRWRGNKPKNARTGKSTQANRAHHRESPLREIRARCRHCAIADAADRPHLGQLVPIRWDGRHSSAIASDRADIPIALG
jgi:hypothetical protein